MRKAIRNWPRYLGIIFCLWTATFGLGLSKEAMLRSGCQKHVCGFQGDDGDRAGGVGFGLAVIPDVIPQSPAKSEGRLSAEALGGVNVRSLFSQPRSRAGLYARHWPEIRRRSRQVSWPLRC